ncbi:sulfatase-like hydrolase/transferase [Labrys neptuniae]
MTLLSFSALFALSAGTWFRILVIVLIFLSQAIWLSSIVYFGAPLTPEQIRLFFMDTADSVSTGLRVQSEFLLPMLVSLAVAALLVVVTVMRPMKAGRSWVFSVLLLVVLGGVGARWALHSLPSVVQPNVYSPSFLASANAGVLAYRESRAPAPPASLGGMADHVFTKVDIPEGRATVVFVMGESINPARMSLFGGPRETTPRLDHLFKEPPAGWKMFAKIGFSGGVATLASVPSALRMVYFPNMPERQPRNIFDVAKDGDFASYYYSAQAIHTMQIAGGARYAKDSKTVETYDEALPKSVEESLADDVQAVPPAPRRFIYIHQRADHEPYLANCKKYTSEFKTFAPSDDSSDEARRTRYDNGLQCWDRSTSDIVGTLLAQKDPVYVFMTSDHNEMMGEDGLWGHLIRKLPVSVVPVMLMTNRPDSAIAAAFQKFDRPTQFQLLQLTAQAMGTTFTVKQYDPSVFYVNGTMPFGQAKYMKVERLPGDEYRISHYSRDASPAEPTENVSLKGVPKEPGHTAS